METSLGPVVSQTTQHFNKVCRLLIGTFNVRYLGLNGLKSTRQ